MRTIITFGQSHSHWVKGIRFDADCVAAIPCKDEAEGRKKAFHLFDHLWCFSYVEEEFDASDLISYFPRGKYEIDCEVSYELS